MTWNQITGILRSGSIEAVARVKRTSGRTYGNFSKAVAQGWYKSGMSKEQGGGGEGQAVRQP